MKYAELDGTRVETENGQDKLLAALYTHAAGRILLKPFTGAGFSKAVGWFMNQPVSARLIASAIQEYRIDMTRYEETVYRTYNEFFTRRLCKEARQTTFDPDWLISPSDGKVSVYPITEKGKFRIKNTPYTMRRLLRDSGLAKRYEGGFLFVIRLTVDDYHRYCYPADGAKTGNRKVDGYFHTVNPVANDYYPIYKENTREYTCIRSEEFGDVLQMEVGDVSDILAIPLIGIVPDDENVVIAANQGEPLVGNGTLAGRAYKNICCRVLGQETPFLNFERRISIWTKVTGIFHRSQGGVRV